MLDESRLDDIFDQNLVMYLKDLTHKVKELERRLDGELLGEAELPEIFLDRLFRGDKEC